MSKHNKVNYSKFANDVKEDVIEKTSIDQVEEVTEESVEEVIEETVEEVVSPVGIVSGCLKLRVRENPSPNAKVICEIKENSAVIINEKESTHEFYKVTTEAGADGYCMKKFITIK